MTGKADGAKRTTITRFLEIGFRFVEPSFKLALGAPVVAEVGPRECGRQREAHEGVASGLAGGIVLVGRASAACAWRR